MAAMIVKKEIHSFIHEGIIMISYFLIDLVVVIVSKQKSSHQRKPEEK
jgi:hypothetical protein